MDSHVEDPDNGFLNEDDEYLESENDDGKAKRIDTGLTREEELEDEGSDEVAGGSDKRL